MKHLTEIILIEDDRDDVNLTLRALRKANLENAIHVLPDGEAALNFIFPPEGFSSRPPELILLDLNLPKVHGLEVLRRIKSDQRTKNIPVTILTGALPEERGVMEAYKLGAIACITKPLTFAKFAEAVAEIGFQWRLLSRSNPSSEG